MEEYKLRLIQSLLNIINSPIVGAEIVVTAEEKLYKLLTEI